MIEVQLHKSSKSLKPFTNNIIFSWNFSILIYKYKMTWIYDNQSDTIYNMSSKDLGLPVFPEIKYQMINMETSYENSVLHLLEEDDHQKILPNKPILIPKG